MIKTSSPVRIDRRGREWYTVRHQKGLYIHCTRFAHEPSACSALTIYYCTLYVSASAESDCLKVRAEDSPTTTEASDRSARIYSLYPSSCEGADDAVSDRNVCERVNNNNNNNNNSRKKTDVSHINDSPSAYFFTSLSLSLSHHTYYVHFNLQCTVNYVGVFRRKRNTKHVYMIVVHVPQLSLAKTRKINGLIYLYSKHSRSKLRHSGHVALQRRFLTFTGFMSDQRLTWSSYKLINRDKIIIIIIIIIIIHVLLQARRWPLGYTKVESL
jgi:hypothetical protein